MSLPSITGVGRLTQDAELRFAPSGVAVCTVNLAFNSSKKDAAGNWVDGDSFFIRGTAFKQVAENIAETLKRGDEVVVAGRLKTDQWETREGEKRSSPSLLIDSIGPSLRYATAKVNKAARGGGGGSSDADPWGSAPQSGGLSTEPPF